MACVSGSTVPSMLGRTCARLKPCTLRGAAGMHARACPPRLHPYALLSLALRGTALPSFHRCTTRLSHPPAPAGPGLSLGAARTSR